MGEENENLVCPSLWDFKRSLTCRKILRHGTSGFSVREEVVLRIFIALKNPSPWLGSNAQPLGPVASTLTTTPPRRLRSVRPGPPPASTVGRHGGALCEGGGGATEEDGFDASEGLG
jgi:hypothetical protein